jgi:hypothetical protein
MGRRVEPACLRRRRGAPILLTPLTLQHGRCPPTTTSPGLREDCRRSDRPSPARNGCEPGSAASPMTDDRWPGVKRLFEAAVERPLSERSAFVSAAVAADETLRRDVESLLAADTADASLNDSAVGPRRDRR